MKPVITIDGPAGAGKSTVARGVAEALGYLYVDTGAMYRALTWKILNRGISPDDIEAVAAVARDTDMDLVPGREGTRVWMDGRDVTDRLRRPEVNAAVSRVARIAEVRRVLLDHQRRYAQRGGVVLEGRDTGSHVAPGAEYKFFLTADFKERVRRRHEELRAEGFELTREAVARDLRQRDRMDSDRENAPLEIPRGAVVLDTTHLAAEEAVRKILKTCRNTQAGS